MPLTGPMNGGESPASSSRRKRGEGTVRRRASNNQSLHNGDSAADQAAAYATKLRQLEEKESELGSPGSGQEARMRAPSTREALAEEAAGLAVAGPRPNGVE